jgi:membrane protein required for beta-lactamase induction
MILIAILLALIVEYQAAGLDRVRRFEWFAAYVSWLENRLSGRRWWRGAAGVLAVLAPLLLAVALLTQWLQGVSPVLALLFATCVLVGCLGPRSLERELSECNELLARGEVIDARPVLTRLAYPAGRDHPSVDEILAGILVQACDRLLGVLFWFVVLGPLGALWYRLAAELYTRHGEIRGGFADAVYRLHQLLNWPVARLGAAGYALAGSLVDAIEGWRSAEAASLAVNETVLRESGLGALQYRQIYSHPGEPAPDEAGDPEHPVEDLRDWLAAAHGLVNRMLFIWLTILGLMTLGYWIG